MSLTRAAAREIDRRAADEFGLPTLVLMENAGRGAAELLMRLDPHARPVVVCCGRGNNGGDGFVIARHLELHGVPVRVLLFADPDALTGDAAVNYRVVRASGIPLETHTHGIPDLGGGWVVDALYGTGLRGPVAGPQAAVVAAINRADATVLSVDVPSGLDADTGEPLGPCVRADHTATFVAPKRGFDNPAAAAWTGEVHVVHIGAPRVLVEDAWTR